MTDLGALVLAGGLVGAAYLLRPSKTLAADLGAAVSAALTAAVATWVEEHRLPAKTTATMAAPVADADQMDTLLERGAEAGVAELRALYAARGQQKSDAELYAEAMELLRSDLNFPTDEGY